MSDHRIISHDQQRRIKSPSQLVKGESIIREKKLEEVLEGFYELVGQRCAVQLQDYHKLMVGPLALRVAYLEMSWWRRRMLDLGALKAVVVSYFKSDATPPAPVTDAAAGPTATPAGSESEGDRSAEGTAGPRS